MFVFPIFREFLLRRSLSSFCFCFCNTISIAINTSVNITKRKKNHQVKSHTPLLSSLMHKHNVTPWAMVVGHVMLVDLGNPAHPRTIPYTQTKAYDRKNGQKRGKKKGKEGGKGKGRGKKGKGGGIFTIIDRVHKKNAQGVFAKSTAF